MPEQKITISCPECKQKLRLPYFKSKVLSISCSKCKTKFQFDFYKYNHDQRNKKNYLFAFITLLILINLIIPYLMFKNIYSTIDTFQSQYSKQIKSNQKKYINEIKKIKTEYEKKIAEINPEILKEKAIQQYKKDWDDRLNYNSKYALSNREKALLEMNNLSKDKNKKTDEIVTSIAIKAAPLNSNIHVINSSNGIILDIDFDMSEMTSGETNTKTKHHTIDSLKNEVKSLVSKVTYDISEYCNKLGLYCINVGCRHQVNQKDEFGNENVVNFVIYKVKLNTNKIKELNNNSFLSYYSTINYLEIITDKFSELYIIEKGYEK